MWQSAPVPMVTVTFLGNAIVGLMLSLSISLITFPPYSLLFSPSLSHSLFISQSLPYILSISPLPPFTLSALQLSLSFHFPFFLFHSNHHLLSCLLSASHGSCWIIDLMKYLAVILLDHWALRLWSNGRPWNPEASAPSQSPPPKRLSSGDHAHPEHPI